MKHHLDPCNRRKFIGKKGLLYRIYCLQVPPLIQFANLSFHMHRQRNGYRSLFLSRWSLWQYPPRPYPALRGHFANYATASGVSLDVYTVKSELQETSLRKHCYCGSNGYTLLWRCMWGTDHVARLEKVTHAK